MAPLIPREVVPMPIQQMRKNLRLHLTRRQRSIFIRIALVPRAKVRRRNSRTVRVDRRREQHEVPIRRPLRVISLGRNPRQLLRIARRAGSRIKVRRPNLLAVLSSRNKEHGVPIRGKLHPRVSRPGHRNLERGSARTGVRSDRLQPQLRCLAVRLQVDRGHAVSQPLPIRRNGRLPQPFHLHHVLKRHGPFGLGIAHRHRGKNTKKHEQNGHCPGQNSEAAEGFTERPFGFCFERARF